MIGCNTIFFSNIRYLSVPFGIFLHDSARFRMFFVDFLDALIYYINSMPTKPSTPFGVLLKCGGFSFFTDSIPPKPLSNAQFSEVFSFMRGMHELY